MFQVVPEPALFRVELHLDGRFDHDPRALLPAMKRAVPLVRRPDGSFDFLADFSVVRSMPLAQSRSGEKVMEWCREHGLRKCASVVASATQRMVVARKTANDPRFEFFITREEAEDWLAEAKLAGEGPASGRALAPGLTCGNGAAGEN